MAPNVTDHHNKARPDKSAGADRADGAFSITFTTNINSTTNDANNALNTAYNAIDA